MSKCGVFSGLYFSAFGMNTERWGVSLVFSPNAGKYGPEKTPYLDTFHAVVVLYTHIAQLMTHTKNVYVAATAYLAIMLLRL